MPIEGHIRVSSSTSTPSQVGIRIQPLIGFPTSLFGDLVASINPVGVDINRGRQIYNFVRAPAVDFLPKMECGTSTSLTIDPTLKLLTTYFA